MSINYFAPDLTQHAPRSARVRLGGYVILPRVIDKARASLTGKLGEYNYNCPLDQRFLSFTGVCSDAFLAEVKTGKSDGELLQWIQENAPSKRTEVEIAQWSEYQSNRAPSDTSSRAYYHQTHSELAASRTDLSTWFDLLDLDDYVSYGGKA